MRKVIGLLGIVLVSACSTPEVEKTEIDLYPTETCVLSWYGDGRLILIDKNHSISDTIINCSLNGTSDIDLVVRGYYELKIVNSTTIDVSITNTTKEIVHFNGNTNGLTYQFFNK